MATIPLCFEFFRCRVYVLQSYFSRSTISIAVACSGLSDSGEEAKEKGTRKVGGAGKGKRKKEKGRVRDRPCSPSFLPFHFISLLYIFADQVFIDPTFSGIFVCGLLQSFVVNVCTFLQRRRTRVGCMGVPSLPV